MAQDGIRYLEQLLKQAGKETDLNRLDQLTAEIYRVVAEREQDSHQTEISVRADSALPGQSAIIYLKPLPWPCFPRDIPTLNLCMLNRGRFVCLGTAAKVELVDQILQVERHRRKLRTRFRRFLGRRRCPLRQVRNLGYIGIDLLRRAGLLRCRSSNLRDHVPDLL